MVCDHTSIIDEQCTSSSIKVRALAKTSQFTATLALEELPENKRYWVVRENEKKKKKRKSVEYNAFELIFALCCLFANLHTKTDILNACFNQCKEKGLEGCTKETFEKYQEDVEQRTDSEVQNYIKNFRLNFAGIISATVDKVYLEGKILSTEKLQKLNNGINKKQAKADVYVEDSSQNFYGFSVKQNMFCTKTNYSVEKILSELLGGDEGKKLKKDMAMVRRDVLKNVDIDNKNLKQNRDKANESFYDSLEGTNIYWKLVREKLANNVKSIEKVLIRSMFSSDLQYPLYEFDGRAFEKLFTTENDHIEFMEHKDYYFNKSGKRRKAAKMFYRLVVNSKVYRIEIRFKGNAWSGSPQFQLHVESN